MTEKINDNQQDLSTVSSKETLEKEFDDLTSRSSYLSRQIRARAEMIIALYQLAIAISLSLIIETLLPNLFRELQWWACFLFGGSLMLISIWIWNRTNLSTKIYKGCIEKRKKKFVNTDLNSE